ncbi:hypothetical protein QEH42_gp261 [Microbacterium phage Pumpernickel]|uniref:Uncharacterized protein n=1 Tax=Microbacterium phage Pumpernickel TaxID=2885983 RepID=A0AAE8YA06_9CAUD|nr:hypothetical protein QEH42_gp261 [Microbacterium phage Pumpernickel]UDL15957.1 hypothetical protein SEA_PUMPERNICKEL_207 [Microbacterium phage Pumpernickel]
MARHRDRDTARQDMIAMRDRFDQQQAELWEELLEEFAVKHNMTDEEVEELDRDAI